MPCPKCGGNDLWDDLMAWGCNRCDWFTADGSVRNTNSSYDTFRDYQPKDPIRQAARYTKPKGFEDLT